MPVWMLITIIVVVWLLAMAGIVVFMMGAARGREREKQAAAEHGLQPATRQSRHEAPTPES